MSQEEIFESVPWRRKKLKRERFRNRIPWQRVLKSRKLSSSTSRRLTQLVATGVSDYINKKKVARAAARMADADNRTLVEERELS